MWVIIVYYSTRTESWTTDDPKSAINEIYFTKGIPIKVVIQGTASATNVSTSF